MASSSSSLQNKTPMKSKISSLKHFDGNDVNNLSTQTPEKPILPPSRTSRRHHLNRTNVVMSVNEIRNAAKSLHEPRRKPDLKGPIPSSSSARRKIQISVSGSDSGLDRRPNSLPEKYKILEEFFNCLDNSVRLNRMKGISATFGKISVSIETLTGRRFSYGHLAQLKFFLPEAIVLRKIMSLDERTSCMRPELHICLDADAVKSDDLNLKSGSGKNSNMRKVFLSRLEAFVKSHPEGCDVPEGELPEPFGRVAAKSGLEADESSSSRVGANLELPGAFADGSTSSLPLGHSATTINHETPTKMPVHLTPLPAKIHEPPAKYASSPSKLMISTPALQTPKRCIMSPDDSSANKLPDKLTRRSISTRQLNFSTPDKNTAVGNGNNDVLGILSGDLLSSIQEKERVIMEESDPAMSQAKRRRAMIANLPKLFNGIHLFFQAMNKSVVTKDELIHKILAYQLDITDRGELEERVLLLQELVPEWISEKIASSGDRLIRINKSLDTQLIRARLADAQ